MYSAENGLTERTPRVLLLDEPDAPLHPQMVQHFYRAMDVLANKFDCQVIFTTHSPTTVALADEGSIYRISEDKLSPIEKDAAIAELLVGVNQVSIHYTNSRQVFVESSTDARIYSELFRLLKIWERIESPYISLSFVPASPKLPPASVRSIYESNIGKIDDHSFEKFITALNGQGNCDSVKGTVDSLVGEGNPTVHGIIDWDTRNKPTPRIHILGSDLFYSIENGILNPLTLGIYLFSQHRDKIHSLELGVPVQYDMITMFSDRVVLQGLAESISRRVLGREMGKGVIRCEFVDGNIYDLSKEYCFHQGHSLEEKIKSTFPFLKQFTTRKPLLNDVIEKAIAPWGGRTLPKAYSEIFDAIQRG